MVAPLHYEKEGRKNMAVRYVARTNDLWLRVQLEPGPIVSVPYGLKVEFLETKAGRDRFTIVEEVNKGKLASVPSRPVQPYLTSSIVHRPAVLLTFDRKTQRLSLPGRMPINAFSGGGHRGFTAIAAGTYELAIPAYPSAQTRPAYSRWTRYHNLWFRIGTATSGSRFLHPGAISEGCVTVRQFIYDPTSRLPPPDGFTDLTQLARFEPGLIGLPLPTTIAMTFGWDKVVDALILARLNDQAIGRLVVV